MMKTLYVCIMYSKCITYFPSRLFSRLLHVLKFQGKKQPLFCQNYKCYFLERYMHIFNMSVTFVHYYMKSIA